jgi:hypothetical protein
MQKLNPRQQALAKSFFLTSPLMPDGRVTGWMSSVYSGHSGTNPPPLITAKWSDDDGMVDSRLAVKVLEDSIGDITYTVKDPQSDMGDPPTDGQTNHDPPDWLNRLVKPESELSKEMKSRFWPDSDIPTDAMVRWRYRETGGQQSIKAKWFESAGVSKHRMLTVGGDYPGVTTGTSRRRPMTGQEVSDYHRSKNSRTSRSPHPDNVATGPKQVEGRSSGGPLPSGSTPSSGTRGSRRAKFVNAVLRR